MPTQIAQCMTRKVSFIFYCAPRDDQHLNPMYHAMYSNDDTRTGVTDSAPYLTGMPYVLVDADTHAVIYPYNSTNGRTATFPNKEQMNPNALQDGLRFMHSLPPVNIPDHVTRIALHIANDAYLSHRNFQLFAWTVPDAAHSKVHVYEVRSDLQRRFAERNQLDTPPAENTLAVKPGTADEYHGYLNGDVWLSISHEFTDDEITRLCPPETLSRALLPGQHPVAPQGTAGNAIAPVPPAAAPGMQAVQLIQQTYAGPITGVPHPPLPVPQPHPPTPPQTAGNTQSLPVDWVAVLQPIYGAGAGSRSMAPFSVRVDALGITVTFTARAVANAVNTSSRTTVQQALRRTSPRAFAAVLKAAWRLHISSVDFSSSWRPMLGSRLHRMGVALDVTHFDDADENIHFTIHNHDHHDRNSPFPVDPGGQKLAALYRELRADQQTMPAAVYTPWLNWVIPHDTHMHVTVKE
ncbi:hypothetical protein [Paraburkholderia kirstenboschensis]|uniref:Uncharacterized protein n=1 Tax=Paraburkholderia kirstenboschensis TaxID=1245436 RepID=A0ABZ0ENI7_9BURK|nr:hypothetical protein [Paraburkholderia kirstenboschensis]WOD18753.1 hypothetical protein RW095_39345 [Paraburkholderia kirstenboschensis]